MTEGYGRDWLADIVEALEVVRREVAIQCLLLESGTAATAPEDE